MMVFRGRGRKRQIICLTLTGILVCLLLHLNEDTSPDLEYVGNDLAIQPQTPACQAEKHNIVYIKMIKCASETITSILRRFGYLRKISFVLPPKKRIYIGWPFDIHHDFYRPSKTGEFNILCEHAVYKEEIFEKLMPKDTKYVTSLREPYSQFKSMFNYYKIAEISNVTGNDPVSEYLNNIHKYEAIYKSPQAAKTRYCIPDGMSMSRNLMSYNLGFPLGYPRGVLDLSHNPSDIGEWLDHLHSKFDLVMIVEYFDESLILLKRLMCWSLKDILFHSQNIGQYDYKEESELDKNNREVYKEWSNVDHALYDHFLKVFWVKVSEEGSGFIDEVDHFREIRSRVLHFCQAAGSLVEDSIMVESSEWNEEFFVNTEYCKLMQKPLLKQIKAQYDENPTQVIVPDPKVKFC